MRLSPTIPAVRHWFNCSDSSSMFRLNSTGAKIPPCLTPLDTRKGAEVLDESSPTLHFISTPCCLSFFHLTFFLLPPGSDQDNGAGRRESRRRAAPPAEPVAQQQAGGARQRGAQHAVGAQGHSQTGPFSHRVAESHFQKRASCPDKMFGLFFFNIHQQKCFPI